MRSDCGLNLSMRGDSVCDSSRRRETRFRGFRLDADSSRLSRGIGELAVLLADWSLTLPGSDCGLNRSMRGESVCNSSRRRETRFRGVRLDADSSRLSSGIEELAVLLAGWSLTLPGSDCGLNRSMRGGSVVIRAAGARPGFEAFVWMLIPPGCPVESESLLSYWQVGRLRFPARIAG